MTPAARALSPSERQQETAGEPGPSDTAATPEAPATDEIPDCPVDIPDTTVAVLAEARGVTMVFKVADPSDATALEAVRLRVRALADHYRREPIVLDRSKDLQRTASRDEAGASPSLTPRSDVSGGSAVRANTRRVDAETGQTIGASGQYSVVVQDTSDGSKIVISSNNPAELDLLRARMTQDAQVMMQAGSCPW